MRKLQKTQKITFSAPIKDNEFAYVEMTINNFKSIKCVVNNTNSLILRKAERQVKEVFNIHIKILKTYEKIR